MAFSSKARKPEGDVSIGGRKTRSDSGRQPRSRFAPEYEILLGQLVEARKKAGITQEEVAHSLGKTQSHVSMCENREREISIIDLWKWCGALGLTMTDFVRQFEDEIQPVAKTLPY